MVWRAVVRAVRDDCHALVNSRRARREDHFSTLAYKEGEGHLEDNNKCYSLNMS